MEGQAVVHLVQPVRQQHAFTFATLDIWRAEDVSFRLSEWKVINTGRTHDKLLQCAEQWVESFFDGAFSIFCYFLTPFFCAYHNIYNTNLNSVKLRLN